MLWSMVTCPCAMPFAWTTLTGCSRITKGILGSPQNEYTNPKSSVVRLQPSNGTCRTSVLPVYPSYSISQSPDSICTPTHHQRPQHYPPVMTSHETTPLFADDHVHTTSPRVADLVNGFENVTPSHSSNGGGLAASREISRSRHSLSPQLTTAPGNSQHSTLPPTAGPPVMNSLDDDDVVAGTVDHYSEQDVCPHASLSPSLSPQTAVDSSLVVLDVDSAPAPSPKNPLLDDNENLTNGVPQHLPTTNTASSNDVVDLSLPASSAQPLLSNGHQTGDNSSADCRLENGARIPPILQMPVDDESSNGLKDPGPTGMQLTHTKRTLQPWAAEYTGVEDGHYYIRLMVDQRTHLNKMCSITENILEAFDINEEVAGILRTTIGKARLVIKKRLTHFEKLCNNQINQVEGTQFYTKLEDLCGFWEVVLMQVDDICDLFGQVEMLRLRNWEQFESPKTTKTKSLISTPSKTPKKTVKAGKTKSKDSGKAAARDAARRKLIEMKRAAAKQQAAASQAKKDREVEIYIV